MQANFFRNIGSILTFAFAGTFISAIVLGLVLYVWTQIPLEGLNISFVEAISVGATLSATDPVTILAIFNLYKVEPKLYTVIFGEALLNDAIAIVLFETAQKYADSKAGSLTALHLFEAIGVFLLVFFGSMLVGIVVGIATALGLKHTHVRRMPKIESCLIVLVAYASYFFSNGVHLSGKLSCRSFFSISMLISLGIVSLLFCGITLKHYAYYNMSRRTQLTTKYLFQVMAQLSENFIFIYLGLDLFVERNLQFKPLFILVAVFGICLSRYLAVFPLSKAINWFIRIRAQRRGKDVADELPFAYQAMLFWAGLRGAVGVALAAGLKGINAAALRATVLVVVVLTVIIFGGTTARMLEILGIRTGVVEDLDSDDEFDIEVTHTHGGAYYYKRDNAIGYTPRRFDSTIPMDGVRRTHSYSSGNSRVPSPRAQSRSGGSGSRRGSAWKGIPYSSSSTTATGAGTGTGTGTTAASRRDRQSSTANLGVGSSDDELVDRENVNIGNAHAQTPALDIDPVDDEPGLGLDADLDDHSYNDDDHDHALPPSAPTRFRRSTTSQLDSSALDVPPPHSLGFGQGQGQGQSQSQSVSPARRDASGRSARETLRGIFSGGPSGDHGAWFRQLDEDFIKPHLLLDHSEHKGPGAV